MDDLKNQMLNLVKESLPEATAGEMKKYIEDAEAIKKSLTKAKDEIHAAKEAIIGLTEENKCLLSELKAFKKREEDIKTKTDDLDAREDLVGKRERDILNTVLQNQLIAAEKTQGDILRLVEKVFGHPGVSISNSKTIGHPQVGGVYTADTFDSETIIKKQTKE